MNLTIKMINGKWYVVQVNPTDYSKFVIVSEGFTQPAKASECLINTILERSIYP